MNTLIFSKYESQSQDINIDPECGGIKVTLDPRPPNWEIRSGDQRSGISKPFRLLKCTHGLRATDSKQGFPEPQLELGSWENLFKAGHQSHKAKDNSKEKNLVKETPGINEKVVRSYIQHEIY